MKHGLTVLILLLLINLAAHFIPFERNALSPDDYTYLVDYGRLAPANTLANTFKVSDRPLNYLFLVLQGKFISDNHQAALIFVFLSSVLLLFAAYYLFLQIFNDRFSAFFAALLFCLFPNKLETYHTLIFLNINLAIAIFILSMAFFMKFLRSQKKAYLVASSLGYLAGIFWYEVGFFLPLVLAAYCLSSELKGGLKYLWPFFAAAGFYLVFRFGMVSADKGALSQHTASLAGFPLAALELLHHCCGRYLLRNLIYGFYLFSLLPKGLFVILVVLDAFILIVLRGLTQDGRVKTFKHQIIFSAAVFVFFIAPLFLNKGGGIGGRHMVLPSIGLVMIFTWFLAKTRLHWSGLSLAVIAALLVVSQGNSWAQVVSCRINRAIYDNLKAGKDKLLASQRIVFDNKSFSDKIKFTLVERDFNLLNTYFGAQALEDRGLVSMVDLAVDHIDKPVFVAKGPLNFTPDGQVNFEVIAQEDYRRIRKAMVSLPQEGTLVIGFNDVFKADHNYGFITNER